jgi:hypothetical protein
MMKKAWAIAGLVTLAAGLLGAQAKPNFSGTWVLDVSKSDWGQMPPPDSIVSVIEHKEPKVKVTTTQKGLGGEITNERQLTTDGQENMNKFRTQLGVQDVKSTTKWNGRTLTTSFTVEAQGTVSVTDNWDVSPDGKVLTVTRDLTTAQGPVKQKLVFNKQ